MNNKNAVRADRSANESSSRSHIAADLLLIADLHDHAADHDAIVGLWARCYDGLLQAGPFGDELRDAVSRFCQSLTEIPSYVDDRTAAALAADFMRIHPSDGTASATRQSTGLPAPTDQHVPDGQAARRWAQRRGHRVEEWRQIEPWHLSTRLRYLAYLVAGDGVAAPPPTLENHLETHLLAWTDSRMAEVANRSATDLYRDLAVMTAAYLHELDQRLALGQLWRSGPPHPSGDARQRQPHPDRTTGTDGQMQIGF